MAPGRLSVLARGRPERVQPTHLRKLMFPAAGLTKGDVLNFYERIAPHLLPFLHGRPVTLERLPEGLVGGKAPHFWQKNTPAYYPAWIPRLTLPAGHGKPVSYVLINHVETLLYLVNQGALTFHIWPSRIEDLDHPDFVLFDLDPGQASFDSVVELARALHDLLGESGVESYVKTSGKSGLHVFTRWERPGGYDESRAWALAIARQLVGRRPRAATTERARAGRHGRIYVDVMPNARGHHVVPPYVLRAVPAATVSMPLRWAELKPGLTPDDFTVRTVLRRLQSRKRDPLAGLLGPGAAA
jgi:bifunctional non-homologous end joining protein LigD